MVHLNPFYYSMTDIYKNVLGYTNAVALVIFGGPIGESPFSQNSHFENLIFDKIHVS